LIAGTAGAAGPLFPGISRDEECIPNRGDDVLPGSHPTSGGSDSSVHLPEGHQTAQCAAWLGKKKQLGEPTPFPLPGMIRTMTEVSIRCGVYTLASISGAYSSLLDR